MHILSIYKLFNHFLLKTIQFFSKLFLFYYKKMFDYKDGYYYDYY